MCLLYFSHDNLGFLILKILSVFYSIHFEGYSRKAEGICGQVAGGIPNLGDYLRHSLSGIHGTAVPSKPCSFSDIPYASLSKVSVRKESWYHRMA